ncbi:MAG: class I SAM-dependent methyltransferase [Pedosphaera sp.]|nr:class I SAM-dependent methyltransferase [Pedosphaera sp.]
MLIPNPQSNANQEFSPETVVRRYDDWAASYDEDRFENSYGRYVHAQEERLLRRWLASFRGGRVLSLACGTGRFMEFASHGLDPSHEMAAVARRKHPAKTILVGCAEDLPKHGLSFNAIFCLHLFMHLTPSLIAQILEVCAQCVRPGGVLIFDLPSARRRALTGFRPAGWHAGNALTHPQVQGMLGERWRIRHCRGILFFPIHRVPSRLRTWLRPLDDAFSTTPLKHGASYLIYCAQRLP